jgi:hypothetical protein
MKADAASAGFYEAIEWNRQRFPRIQILTIADLLAGKEINYPKALNVTFKVAPKGKYTDFSVPCFQPVFTPPSAQDPMKVLVIPELLNLQSASNV